MRPGGKRRWKWKVGSGGGCCWSALMMMEDDGGLQDYSFRSGPRVVFSRRSRRSWRRLAGNSRHSCGHQWRRKRTMEEKRRPTRKAPLSFVPSGRKMQRRHLECTFFVVVSWPWSAEPSTSCGRSFCLLFYISVVLCVFLQVLSGHRTVVVFLWGPILSVLFRSGGGGGL